MPTGDPPDPDAWDVGDPELPDPDTPDPDAADPGDRTMARMELAAGIEELYPGLLARMAAATGRSDVFLGWLSPATPPAGVELSEWDDSEPSAEAVALPWRAAASPYVVLCPPEAPDAWIRGGRGVMPGSYSAEAALLTHELDPGAGVRRWQLLTADDAPVQLCDDPAGHQRPRDWVLRADTAYQLERDIEGGWRVHGLS